MLLQECRPHKHISHLRLFRNILRERLSRTNRAQTAALLRDGLRGGDGGRVIPDSIEDISQIGSGGLLELVDDGFVAVVEGVAGAEGLDKVVVARAAGGDNTEAVVLGNLDGVLADTCYSVSVPVSLRC